MSTRRISNGFSFTDPADGRRYVAVLQFNGRKVWGTAEPLDAGATDDRIGLGDVVAGYIEKTTGIKTEDCPKCPKRRAALNKIKTPLRRRAKEATDG